MLTFDVDILYLTSEAYRFLVTTSNGNGLHLVISDTPHFLFIEQVLYANSNKKYNDTTRLRNVKIAAALMACLNTFY